MLRLRRDGDFPDISFFTGRPEDVDRASPPRGRPNSDEDVLGMRSPHGRTALFPFSPTRLAEEGRRFSKAGPIIRVMNTGAKSTHMQRLAQARLVSMPEEELRELYPFAETEEGGRTALVLRARILADPAPHKLKAAALLEGEGLTEEALSPATEAARLTAGCLARPPVRTLNHGRMTRSRRAARGLRRRFRKMSPQTRRSVEPFTTNLAAVKLKNLPSPSDAATPVVSLPVQLLKHVGNAPITFLGRTVRSPLRDRPAGSCIQRWHLVRGARFRSGGEARTGTRVGRLRYIRRLRP